MEGDHGETEHAAAITFADQGRVVSRKPGSNEKSSPSHPRGTKQFTLDGNRSVAKFFQAAHE